MPNIDTENKHVFLETINKSDPTTLMAWLFNFTKSYKSENYWTQEESRKPGGIRRVYKLKMKFGINV